MFLFIYLFVFPEKNRKYTQDFHKFPLEIVGQINISCSYGISSQNFQGNGPGKEFLKASRKLSTSGIHVIT